ncbi:GNAT family N-acetyltransferase [Adlercreutzia mucosicola]|uniref:GNAT family N-acetyltransferase n=1 Tax=Adlercreutzia mucosicola TaxID=580026 RepID=A0A6N8JNV8_9ACTN|nr:GNAT family N-acetyltransferase [Adlercreutzia mucosicola]MCR2035440.1 GNAT family N-acetyltransferase [Adlercreutzia mucosicola]MVX61538.1 GNAT family N-acetyltransferase [Adlercreutzia mucosicola]
MLTVRRARIDEFDAVLDFYTQMIDQMQGTDFDVRWRHGEHPSPAFLRESLEAGQVIIGLLGEGEDVKSAGCEVAASEAATSGAGVSPAGAVDGEGAVIASAMVVNHEGAPGYAAVSWDVDAAPEQVGVLHVVATLPAYHGRGFARQLLRGGIEIARGDGLVALRLDTFPHNIRGRGLYKSCGFTDHGLWTVHYPALGDIQVVMYELLL